MKNYLQHFDSTDPKTWSTGLIVFASVVAIMAVILFIVTMIWFFIWIKYSWFHKTNSVNLTGGQLSKIYLEKYGVNASRIIKFRGFGDASINKINVESKFFYLRPYKVANNSLTLRLLPWTYHRSSIYTLAMAMESTWVISSSKSSRLNSFWWDFSRKITLFFVLLPLIFAALFALGPYLGWSSFVNSNSNMFVIILLIIFAIFFIFYSLSQMIFYAKSRKEISKNLQGILLPNEIKAIGWIFQIKFVYYLIRTIYEILRLILQIIILTCQEKK